MATTVYRSLGFTEGTNWGPELLLVEVLTDETKFDVLIYDRGFEPPYYDVSKPFGLDSFQRPKMTGGLKEAHHFLKDHHISVAAWRQTPLIYAHESNSVIREDIRMDIRESIYKDKQIPPPIAAAIGEKAIRQIAEYAGHSAEVSLHFVRSEVPLSFSGTFYLMFRTPPQYPAWGFVAKGGHDKISLLVECNGTVKCQLYDQNQRLTFQTGQVIYAKVDFTTTPIGFELTYNGHKSYPATPPTLFTF